MSSNFLSSVTAVTAITPLVQGSGSGYLYFRSENLETTRVFAAAMLYYRNRSYSALQGVIDAYWKQGSASVTPIAGQNTGYEAQINRFIKVVLVTATAEEREDFAAKIIYFVNPFLHLPAPEKICGSFYYGSLVAANYMACRDTGTGAQIVGRYNAFCSECTASDPLVNTALNEITPLEVKIANSGITATSLLKVVIKTMITELESTYNKTVYAGVEFGAILKQLQLSANCAQMSIFNTAFEMYAHCRTQLVMVPEVLSELVL